jgi:CRP/FNR family transcriptional regulator, cyclic AMP receptor protein
MGSTHRTDPIETRPHRPGEFFSFLPSEAISDLQSFVSVVCLPAHMVLFEEEQEARNIVILVEGCAKISVNSSDGRRLILWIAKPGALLGLTSVLRGSCHEVTAETVHPCTIASIRRQEFLDFLLRHPAAYQGVARELSVEMSRACDQMRIMGLSASATIKLAWLLLKWSDGGRMTRWGTSVAVPMTHEEMGECIGVTRETVSRAMTYLRRRGLIDVQDSALIVTNRFALGAFAKGLHRAVRPECDPLPRGPGRPRLPGIGSRKVTEITAGRKFKFEA